MHEKPGPLVREGHALISGKKLDPSSEEGMMREMVCHVLLD
jgi:hypothetical protein